MTNAEVPFSIDAETAASPLSVEVSAWANGMANALTHAYGYVVNLTVKDDVETSSTGLSLKDKTISVDISSELLAKAETSDRLDWLGFNVLHELGHVKRFQAESFETATTKKDAYFANITDDIAINYAAAKQTRFVADITKKAYDEYLFPVERRGELQSAPRHKQFMESLLVLAMTTRVREHEDVPAALAKCKLEGLDADVVESIQKVTSHEAGGRTYNLLEQIREFGEDLPYFNRTVAPIRELFDSLCEKDRADMSGGSTSPDGAGTDGASDTFDYTDSAGCGSKTADKDEETQPETGENTGESNAKKPAAPGEEEAQKDEGAAGDIGAAADSDDTSADDAANQQHDALDDILKDAARSIAETIKEAADNIARSDQTPSAPKPSAKQLEQLRESLGLDRPDFTSFMQTAERFRAEITAVADMVAQLRRERTDTFLAPGNEVAMRGRKISIPKLLGYLASGLNNRSPEIWKIPTTKERTEYEFDGIDIYFLCDSSGSMAKQGKAEAASDVAVVLAEGLREASQMAWCEEPPVRIQIQAFSSGDEVLCPLTDEPSVQHLGSMYSALRHPSGLATYVSGALEKIEPDKRRISIVIALSDGEFYDFGAASREASHLIDDRAVLLQCTFGGAVNTPLDDRAIGVSIDSGKDLPGKLLGIMPTLVDIAKRPHA